MSEVEVQDFAGKGIHNADLDKATDRLIKGGSWKKQRIVVIIPGGDMVPLIAAMSWWAMIFPPNQAWTRIPVQGMEVGDAYSHAIDQILAHPELSQWEYVLTLEIDNIPPPDGVVKIVAAMEERPDLATISGLYFTKGFGGVAQIWGDANIPGDYKPMLPRAGEIVECNGTGMGFALWRMSMFKDERLKRPLFETKAGREGSGTQDLAFWQEAKKYGYRCGVDCRVPVGHLDYKGDFGEKGFIY